MPELEPEILVRNLEKFMPRTVFEIMTVELRNSKVPRTHFTPRCAPPCTQARPGATAVVRVCVLIAIILPLNGDPMITRQSSRSGSVCRAWQPTPRSAGSARPARTLTAASGRPHRLLPPRRPSS